MQAQRRNHDHQHAGRIARLFAAAQPPSHVDHGAHLLLARRLAALINAAKVDRAVFTGDLAAAERMSAAARKLSFWAFGVFGAVVVLYVGFIAIMIATTVSNLKPLQ